MTGEIPTKFGDVLILTGGAGSVHVVCPVAVDGQQGGTSDRYDVSGRSQAVEKARRLVVPARQIFLKDQESGEWEEVPAT